MKKTFFLIFTLLSTSLLSCSSLKQQEADFSDVTYVKSLKKNLKKSEKNLKESEKKVSELKKEIALVQIKAIQKQIENYKNSIEDLKFNTLSTQCDLLLNERAVLFSIIESHPHLATSAQAVLDQILTLITHLNNCE